MVNVDIRYDGDGWRITEKGPTVLTGFYGKERAFFIDMQIGAAKLGKFRSNDRGAAQCRSLQCRSDQTGCSGLSMASGNGYLEARIGNLPECFRVGFAFDPKGSCEFQFRIRVQLFFFWKVRLGDYGFGINNEIGPFRQVFRIVANHYGNPFVPKIARNVTSRGVRPGNAPTKFFVVASKRAYADASCTDNMKMWHTKNILLRAFFSSLGKAVFHKFAYKI